MTHLDPFKPRFNPALAIGIIVALLVLARWNCARGEELTASWYSEASLKKEGTWKTSKGVMANGQRFNEQALTCATRDFKLNTLLKVTNCKNKKTVLVKVTDRIGRRFKGKRIDLSKRAFAQIAPLKQGIIPVKVEIIREAQ